MNKTTAPAWSCGFCCTGDHDACTGAALNPHGKTKILVCGCELHDRRVRCLECGNTRLEELTGWACTNPSDCADAIAARSAANPLREELAIVRHLGGEARRRALHERTMRQVQAAVTACGIDEELGHDVASDAPRRAPKVRASRVVKPKTGTCICGCEGATRGGRFLPGHDAKLKSALKAKIESGDSAAYERMVELGWERFAQASVDKRRKMLDRQRVAI